MLKALLKKQFLELNAYYFQNRKTGKNRSKGGVVLMILLFVFLYAVMGSLFFSMAAVMADPLIAAGLDWVYFAIMGMMGLALGVFGSVFNTYSGLYRAKDNELLLSMPIPPRRILLVRMLGVYAMGLLFEAIVMIPTVLVYWMAASPSGAAVVFSILLIFILAVLVLTLTCALGWVVALVAARLRNKSFFTVLLSLVFFAAYYWFYFRLNDILQNLVANGAQIGQSLRSSVYPIYQMGLAATGSLPALLIFTGIVAALFALTYYLLSRSFLKITTMNRGEKKAVYKEQPVKAGGLRSALLRKELKRFTSSATYMLNCGFGILFLLLGAAFVLIRMGMVRETLATLTANMPMLAEFIPLLAAGLVCLLSATNDLTAPSVSLEGKSLWILQSLPVDPWEALQAKLHLHHLLSGVPAILCTLALALVIRADIGLTASMVLFVAGFVLLSASLGLVLDLKRPNLSWTNESIPVKQSLSVFLALFGGWFLAVLATGAYYLCRSLLNPQQYLLIAGVVLVLLTRLLNRWIQKKGARIFARL